MDFLSQTEQKLAAEISGNCQSLLEQQRDHEVRGALRVTCELRLSLYLQCCYEYTVYVCVYLQLFQAEMFSRQQILYSIINDGHHMLDEGQVDDR